MYWKQANCHPGWDRLLPVPVFRRSRPLRGRRESGARSPRLTGRWHNMVSDNRCSVEMHTLVVGSQEVLVSVDCTAPPATHLLEPVISLALYTSGSLVPVSPEARFSGAIGFIPGKQGQFQVLATYNAIAELHVLRQSLFDFTVCFACKQPDPLMASDHAPHYVRV